MAALLYKDDHNKVAYLEKGKGWEAYEQILDFLNRSHIRYALTYRPTIVFDSLVKQFWATATVRTLEAGPSEIISTIDGNEGGGDYVFSPKSDEAPPTTAATAAGGAEDSAALTDLSLKLDMCINRVTTLENELGVTKKVLGGEEAATKEQDIELNALHKLASTSLGCDTTIKAAYTIYKASEDAHASSDAGHAADAVLDDTTMPFRHTIPAGDGIPADAQTIPAGSSPIPSFGGVSAGSSMDPADQTLERSNLLNFKRTTFRLTPTLEAPSAKRVPQDVHAASSQVPASVSAAPSTATAVSVPAAPSIHVDVSVSAAPSVHADIEVGAVESHLDDTQTASEHVSTEHTVDESTPSSSRTYR
nr:hypothetical protein [Tanacetum cinerariifolium]